MTFVGCLSGSCRLLEDFLTELVGSLQSEVARETNLKSFEVVGTASKFIQSKVRKVALKRPRSWCRTCSS